MIKKLSHNEINKDKWDATISESHNSEIYAFSWFLDCVSPYWAALVYNDYEAVLPLPIKSNHGIRYIVQPPFCQKLGIFSNQEINETLLKEFTKAIFSFVSVRYCSNIQLSKNKKKIIKPNYVIDLQSDYENISKKYNSNCKRNLKKTESLKVRTITINEFIENYTSTLTYSIPQTYSNIIESLLTNANAQNKVEFYAAFETNEICSVVAFLKGEKQYYYLMAGSLEKGKTNGSMFSIIDSFIQNHAGEYMKLDFEGSEIEGVARFYKGFGAKLTPYYYYENHRIPFMNRFIR